jgi:hypothetical protein
MSFTSENSANYCLKWCQLMPQTVLLLAQNRDIYDQRGANYCAKWCPINVKTVLIIGINGAYLMLKQC